MFRRTEAHVPLAQGRKEYHLLRSPLVYVTTLCRPVFALSSYAGERGMQQRVCFVPKGLARLACKVAKGTGCWPSLRQRELG